jgi:hypothetical protein
MGCLFISNILWQEFLQIKDALNEYLNEAAADHSPGNLQ